LYQWTHLELQRYFDVYDILNPDTAKEIYDSCSSLLRTSSYSARNLLRKMDVRLVCTTDDPVDNLEHHQKIKKDGFEIPVLPAFRPDMAFYIDDPSVFKNYLSRLEKSSGISIDSFDQYRDALKKRHDFFAANGCNVADHGLEEIYAEDYTEAEIK